MAKGQRARNRQPTWPTRLAHFAAQQDPSSLVLPRRVRDGDGGEQGRGVGVGRTLVDLVCVALFDDLTEVHDGDVVAEVTDDRQVVGDEEVGDAQLVLELGEQVDHLRLRRHVERARPARRTPAAAARGRGRGRWRCAGAARPRTRGAGAGGRASPGRPARGARRPAAPVAVRVMEVWIASGSPTMSAMLCRGSRDE